MTGNKHIIIHIEETDKDSQTFYDPLGGPGAIASAAEGNTRKLAPQTAAALGAPKALFKLSNATGQMQFTQEAKGNVKKSQLDANDVFIFDCGVEGGSLLTCSISSISQKAIT